MSTMIDVSMATVYSGGVLTIFCFSVIFLFLFSLFSFFPFVCKKTIILYFFVLVLIKCVTENKFIYFFDVVIVNCMTACSGFKMAAQNSKWLLCDVIVTS